MSDVPGGPDTRVFPTYDCHFMGRKQEDIHREFKELVFDILKSRELSRSEEKVLKEVANEAFDIMIASHKSECVQQRTEKEAEQKKTGRDWLGIVINVLSMLIALAAVIFAVHSKTGGGTP